MIRILPFNPEHAAGVVSVILPIQQIEFEIPITLDAQPDLKDISAFYQHGQGNFWVAVDGDTIVGTVALLDIGNNQAALRKMFVASSHRGPQHGVASALLHTLLAWCRTRGIRTVFLGTTAKFLAAHRFYEKNGFREISREALPPAFPVMVVDTKFYELQLHHDEELAALESELIHDPDSYELRERLVSAYAENRETFRDPRRIDHIRWFIRNHPGGVVCRTPFVHVYPDELPDVYAALKEDWLHALAARPADADVVRAAANFLALSDREAALQLLREVVERDPGNGSLRVELGRFSIDLSERLAHFQAGRTLGADDAPNLLVWIAETAAQAADYITAERTALELLASVEEMRAKYGERLDWPDSGEALWTRALGESASRAAASVLVDAISESAYRQHWAHTVLGLVAHARGDIDAAVTHLHDSARLHPDYRLSAYGPSIELARALCVEGRWSEATAYFVRWQEIWEDERAAQWTGQTSRRELPTLPHTEEQ
jgi:GNAT superfamily N-acetyltransferase